MSARTLHVHRHAARQSVLRAAPPAAARAANTTSCRKRGPGAAASRKRGAPATSTSTSTPTGSTTQAAGCDGPEALPASARSRCCARSTSTDDVYRFGLRGTIDAAARGRRDRRAHAGGAGGGAGGAGARPTSRDAGRAVRRRPLQHQRHGRREPAVRHPGRACLRDRRAGRERPMCWRCWRRPG